jgi:hypothetical protein
MKRRSDEPELMGAQEAARTLGVQQPNLRTVAGLPAPYDKVAATTLWRADEIRSLAWKRAHAKQPRVIQGPATTHTNTKEAPAA